VEDRARVFDAARKHEQMVSTSINALYARAISDKDYATQVMLQWFINEQVEEEKTSTTLAEQLRLVGDSATGLLILDRQFGERTKD
jgi:ferritin